MWLLRSLDTDAVEPQNYFLGARAPTVRYDSALQVTVKSDFSEIFEMEKSDGEFIGKVELHYICYLFVKTSVSICLLIVSLLSFILHRW